MSFHGDDRAPLSDMEFVSDQRRAVVTAAIFLLAFGAFLASGWLCSLMLGRMPHVPDEIAYTFQARIFASGRLWIRPPAIPELFAFDHIVVFGDRWCSIYPPGWPLLLAVAEPLGASWLLNPLLLFVTVIGVWRLSSYLFDDTTAWLSAVLFVSSPFVLLSHSGFMAHPATLCFAVWGMLFFVRGIRCESYSAGLTGGLLLGISFLIRPATALPLLWPLLLWPFVERRNLRTLIPAAAGFFPLVILFLAYNWSVFGGPFRTGYLFDPAFRPESVSGRVWSNATWYFWSLNQWPWRWPWPNLLILVPIFFVSRKRKEAALLLLCSASLVICYCFYYYRDIVYGGPRYAFEAMAFLSMLAARGLISLANLLTRASILPGRLANRILGIIVLTLAALSLSHMPAEISFYSQMYHARDHHVVQKVREAPIGSSALILIAGNPYIYGGFFLENALNPEQGGRVFVRDIPEKEQSAKSYYQRKGNWRIRIEMESIAGPNSYPDRWKLTAFAIEPLTGEGLRR